MAVELLLDNLIGVVMSSGDVEWWAGVYFVLIFLFFFPLKRLYNMQGGGVDR